jgi:3-oxoacyl-(acyl-carrier-protein) synthase
MRTRRVLITGLGLITPIGNDRAAVTRSVRALKHGLRRVEWFAECPVKLAGIPEEFELEGFNHAAWRWSARYAIGRETVRSMPPNSVYGYCATEQALADAGLTREALGDGRTGFFGASAGSPRMMAHHVNETAAARGTKVHPWAVMHSVAGTLNFNLAAHYGIRGAVTGFVSACAASGHALGYAFDEIALGRQDRMIVVGAEEPTWEMLVPFSGLRALSRQTEPEKASRPFDVERDGFVGGGGAAAIVLEAEDAAERRGAKEVYAELAGWGQAADGHSVAQSEPEGRGVEAAMRRALADAGMNAGDLNYVSAHATGTVVGDRAEAKALRRVLGESGVAVSGMKALTGHTLSMAGALSVAITSLAVREGFVPGQAHLREADPECAGLNLPRETRDGAVRAAMCNCSGFGGSNVALVLRKA